jgi:wyosine [tRNA(Phe)-imidazoG37] synthetase (radical SAM superfamily)
MSERYKYLFGPVPSRRLGRSLGIDLITFKTCTMNCRFCQLGDSTCALSERKEYVPISDVLAELERWKEVDGEADHITLAGSGEPTLHTGFGEVLQWIRDNTSCPSVLLTNGSLLYIPEVRAAAAIADKVKVTLSAWDEDSFQQIHNPAQGVTFKKLIDGERLFGNEFSGELSVEVFVVEGLNSDRSDIRKIAGLVETLQPDRIDLNTAVRPPADSQVRAISPEVLGALAKEFGPRAKVTAAFKAQPASSLEITPESLLGLIQRHPATALQLAEDFNRPVDEIIPLLDGLVDTGDLLKEDRDGSTYYHYRS